MGAEGKSSSPDKRRPGSRAGLDLNGVVEAARSLDVNTLTIQAVATRLGVDRKAVRHHATDRETLLRLMAADAFSETPIGESIPADCTWQEACRIFADDFTDSVINIDTLIKHLELDISLLTSFGKPTESLVTKLTDAGFDDETALRSLVLLTNICMAFARDAVVVAESGVRPRRELAQLGIDRYQGEFPNFARVVAREIDTYDRKQLELSVDIFVRGMESLLLERVRLEP
ncbi:hypothetical protein ACFT1A_20235 [Rhodococcus sp. NPDC057135]|uniref:hypothetical protein n=1 Tax=Rhodococcus sp. NPDC057135 TaxID=3346028 RepID=UPI003634E116